MTTTTTTGGRHRLRAAYLDLDGTLLGRDGSLLHDGDGDFTLLGVRALEACARAGIEPVLVSGRRLQSMRSAARLLGIRAFGCEAGALLVIDSEEHWLTGDLQPRPDRSIFEQIEDSGAAALVRDRFGLDYHPASEAGREVSHVFNGEGDATEIQAALTDAGHTAMRFLDNGAADEGGRIFHLLPAAASKRAAVEAHRRIRGYGREETIAVGDSAEDAGMADAVGTFWVVANGVWADGTNVRRAQATHGDGVYEAVVTELAERR